MKKTVILTFDDAVTSQLANAVPVLRQYVILRVWQNTLHV